VLGAALTGIEDALEPPPPITGNAYALDLPQMPATWSDAIDAFAADPVMPRILPAQLIENYLATKRQELHYVAQISPQEQIELYLDTV
jgi:glutamine synthetase